MIILKYLIMAMQVYCLLIGLICLYGIGCCLVAIAYTLFGGW